MNIKPYVLRGTPGLFGYIYSEKFKEFTQEGQVFGG